MWLKDAVCTVLKPIADSRGATVQLAHGSVCISVLGSRFRFGFGSCFALKKKQEVCLSKKLPLFCYQEKYIMTMPLSLNYYLA